MFQEIENCQGIGSDKNIVSLILFGETWILPNAGYNDFQSTYTHAYYLIIIIGYEKHVSSRHIPMKKLIQVEIRQSDYTTQK